MTKAEFLAQNIEDTDTVTVNAKEYKALIIKENTESLLLERINELEKALSKMIEDSRNLAKANMELRGQLPTYTIDIKG